MVSGALSSLLNIIKNDDFTLLGIHNDSYKSKRKKSGYQRIALSQHYLNFFVDYHKRKKGKSGHQRTSGSHWFLALHMKEKK